MEISLFEVANLTKGNDGKFNTNTNGSEYANVLDLLDNSDKKTHICYIGEDETKKRVLSVKGGVFLAVAVYRTSDEGTVLELSNISPVDSFISGLKTAKELDLQVVTVKRSREQTAQLETARATVSRLSVRQTATPNPTNGVSVNGILWETVKSVNDDLASVTPTLSVEQANVIIRKLIGKGVTA